MYEKNRFLGEEGRPPIKVSIMPDNRVEESGGSFQEKDNKRGVGGKGQREHYGKNKRQEIKKPQRENHAGLGNVVNIYKGGNLGKGEVQKKREGGDIIDEKETDRRTINTSLNVECH